MGLIDKIVSPVRGIFGHQVQAYKTFTEFSPSFTAWDGGLYEQAQTRAIIERIAVACSKLKPEFVTPDGSGGAVPKVQGLFTSWPNDMMDWPCFLRRVVTLLYVETTTYVVPQYDRRDRSIIGLWPLKPTRAEVVEYEGEPWLRFTLATGDVAVYPFYDVAILTRFQMQSDMFGGGNAPLTPTLRLMDAQRQAEEIALKTGANIRFIGKMNGMVHDNHIKAIRDQFAYENFNPANNPSGIVLYDTTIDQLTQVKNQSYTIDPKEMERIDKALYTYFGINEKILTNSYNEWEWAAFYEGVVEPIAIMLAAKLDMMLLTPTQVRKGNHVMFSSGYLEYATTEAKIKVATTFATAGIGTKNEIRDIFQLPHVPGGDVFAMRGEYYLTDEDNNIVAESGGHGGHDVSYVSEETDEFAFSNETGLS